MIRYTNGNIFESNAMALVNTVNTEGIMGKGLALQFKSRFPENFRAYKKACDANAVALGHMFIYETGSLIGPRYIINFPTKDKWRNRSLMSSIRDGLVALAEEIKAKGITSVAIPPLGCGLGGLPWHDVKVEMERALGHLQDVDIQVFEPLAGDNPAPVPLPGRKLTLVKASILYAFQRYMRMAVSTEMTFVEAHKLCYFMQVFGLDMGLHFAPWRYGPYAKNLKFVFQDMEGIWIEGFGDGTAGAFSTFRLLPRADEAKAVCNPQPGDLFSRLEKFIESFESPLGLELLATVHWLIAEEKIPAELTAISTAIGNWCGNRDGYGTRKKLLFHDDLLRMAVERLEWRGKP